VGGETKTDGGGKVIPFIVTIYFSNFSTSAVCHYCKYGQLLLCQALLGLDDHINDRARYRYLCPLLGPTRLYRVTYCWYPLAVAIGSFTSYDFLYIASHHQTNLPPVSCFATNCGKSTGDYFDSHDATCIGTPAWTLEVLLLWRGVSRLPFSDTTYQLVSRPRLSRLR
jgi:hypothetical protein